MSNFSSAVKLGDLNDFIAPSQACVVTLQGKKLDEPLPSDLQVGQVQLQQRAIGFKQTFSEQEGGPIKVTLHDCLACSGCVTSAETVLLQHQSADEFLEKLRDPGCRVVVSVSPQSRASLAALHGLPAAEVQPRLTSFLKQQLGVDLVLDIGPGRDMALAEAATEFMERYRRSREASTSEPSPAAAAAGAARKARAPAHSLGSPSQLPMLASACPGWICYAEKTHGEFILPHLSTTKSPQAIIGTLVKRLLAQTLGWDPARVYHVAVMPCYDKKLEASREDFYLPGTTIPEVDSCLTTGEMQQLLEANGQAQLPAVAPAPLDIWCNLLLPPPAAAAAAAVVPAAASGVAGPGGANSNGAVACNGLGSSNGSSSGLLQSHQQNGRQQLVELEEAEQQHSRPGSSGGYMDFIFRVAAQQLFGIQLQGEGLLATKQLRNADFQELLLLDPEGKPLLRFASAYGFRNIQALIRRIKGRRCEYDYVEVMACPGGCLNGGGQIAPRKGTMAVQLLQELEALYFQGPAAGVGGKLEGSLQQHQQQRGQQREEQGATAPMDVDEPLPWQQQQQQQEYQQVELEPGVVKLLQPPGAEAAAGAGPWESSGVVQEGQKQQQWASGSPVGAVAEGLYQAWVGGLPGSAAARQLLHTQYHHRKKTVATSISDW